jgi:hypothetical protein
VIEQPQSWLAADSSLDTSSIAESVETNSEWWKTRWALPRANRNDEWNAFDSETWRLW